MLFNSTNICKIMEVFTSTLLLGGWWFDGGLAIKYRIQNVILGAFVLAKAPFLFFLTLKAEVREKIINSPENGVEKSKKYVL